MEIWFAGSCSAGAGAGSGTSSVAGESGLVCDGGAECVRGGTSSSEGAGLGVDGEVLGLFCFITIERYVSATFAD